MYLTFIFLQVSSPGHEAELTVPVSALRTVATTASKFNAYEPNRIRLLRVKPGCTRDVRACAY
jgi:hypothetical protein